MAIPSQYDATISRASQTYGVPESVLRAQIMQESGGNQINPRTGQITTSSTGALGIAQILPSTAADPGYGVSPVDPTDPNASIMFMAQYDAARNNNDPSWNTGLRAYSGNSYSADSLGVSNAPAVSATGSDGQWINTPYGQYYMRNDRSGDQLGPAQTTSPGAGWGLGSMGQAAAQAVVNATSLPGEIATRGMVMLIGLAFLVVGLIWAMSKGNMLPVPV